MGHLVDYEEAVTPLQKALAALECSVAKTSKAGAWSWATTAAEHAEEAGIKNAHELLGTDRWPEIDPLRRALQGNLQSQETMLDEFRAMLWNCGVSAATGADGEITIGAFTLKVASIEKA